jgi:hypothetical protein
MIKTKEAAEVEAKKLWGINAFVGVFGSDYVVGEVNGIFRQAYGYGSSWDKAFKSAKFNIN